MPKIKERTLYIDILKAIACICVLAGHVIAGIAKADISVSEELRSLHTFVYLFHVPCFFFASGYLYANNPVSKWKEYGSLVCKKILALGIPYVACTMVYVGLSSFLSSEMNPNTSYNLKALCNIWRMPLAHYWYLYALIMLFLFIPAVELLFRCANRKCLWIGFIVLMFVSGYFELPCINYILQYSYLFYMGVVWNEIGGGGKQ